MYRALVLLFVLPACGAGSANGGPDASGNADGSDNCPDPTTALPAGYVPIDSVSAGVVDTTPGSTTTTLVDASAGGFGNSDTEPFVYLSFSGTNATKVAITDVVSYDASTWHLGLKRYVIRANGGDSGPAGVRVASVAAASLAEVTAVPADNQFFADDWADDDCALVADGLGAPLTAVGVWYEAADGVLSPLDLVYVIALPSGGGHIKMKIVDYYANPADATQSAYFQIDWAAL